MMENWLHQMILLWYLAAWIQILSKRFVQSLGFFLYFSFSVSSFYFLRDNFLMISIFLPLMFSQDCAQEIFCVLLLVMVG
jgi:hypothetical protein